MTASNTHNVPRCFSTQHPDNVTRPSFASEEVIGGEDEITEAHFVYSELGVGEQIWDFEGKEVDSFVVKKLLMKYPDFFAKKKLGKNFLLTLRVQNPTIEKNEAKVLVETLQSIPRSFDTARAFYKEDIAPIFEVALPMASSAAELNRMYDYYTKFIIGNQHGRISDITLKDWFGEFKPEVINIIPLVEDMKSLTSIKELVKGYIKDKKIEYQRVWLARSDPALNYGWLTAILLNKWAVTQLDELQEESSIDILPMIGVGSAPFRGNFTPENINCLKGYPSVQTFNVQSAFKYDFPLKKVKDAIERINESKRGKAIPIEKNGCFTIIKKYTKEYARQLGIIAPWVQNTSKYIPQRRKRKLHIGLFGYSRGVGGFELPRAIGFAATLYSIGLPPELLAANILTEHDIEFLEHGAYKNFSGDIAAALQYTNLENIRKLFPELVDTAENALSQFSGTINKEHFDATSEVMKALSSSNVEKIKEKIVKAAKIRKFLG